MDNNEKKSSGFSLKVLIIGLPVFIVQLVLVYFITANILLSRFKPAEKPKKAHTEQKEGEEATETEGEATEGEGEGEEAPKKEIGKNILAMEDIIVNPANTNGQKLLLISIGIDMPSKEAMEKLKEKEVVVKDVVIGLLSSKPISILDNFSYRDSLKLEIVKSLKTKIPKTKINDIYFPKFIIQ